MTDLDAVSPLYRFADLTLDPTRRCVTRQGLPIELKPLDFDLLRLLVESAPNVVTADMLAEKVWARHFVSPENLAQRVMLLRQSLGDEASKRRYIETVRNRGYRLIPVVETVPAASVDSEPRPRRLRPAAGVLLLAVGLAAAASYWLGGPAEQVAPLPGTVAVLPFENLSPDPEDAHFAVALHREVINQLVKAGSLDVIRAPSVAGYAGTSKPIAEIARELNVTAVLEATVAYADRRIALNVMLTDTATGRHLWSERYDRALVDAFDIQVDIASRIAAELATELVPKMPTVPARRPTDSSEAYALYLEAVSLGGRENSYDRRMALLDQAIEFDDGFADAYALRATAYAARVVDNTTGDSVAVTARPDYERLARADAERALQLDPASVQALSTLGMMDVFSWRWTSARMRLGPPVRDEDAAFSLLPVYRFILGQHAAAIGSARRAAELSPNDWLPYRNLGWALVLAGDYDAAHDALRKGIELAPNRAILRRWMAYVAAARGDTAEALKEIRLAERLLGDERPRLALAEIAKVYGQLGEALDARRVFDEIMRGGNPPELGAGTLAAAYLAIGDTEQSLVWLRAAAEKVHNHEPDQGFWNLMHLVHDVTRHPALARPEFIEVLERIRGD